MTRRSINIEGLSHGGLPIPQASLVGPLLASGGINGMDPATGDIPADLEQQTDLVFANVRRIVEAAGGRVEDIARCVFYVRDKSCRPLIDAQWTQMFPDPQSRPARHTLVHDLNGPLLVQCELTAYIQEIA
ncbi:RidA family protein [Streptomyces sp. NPDC086080]|uniref:RidA family protein n=1 Tax=Streptomyces sp. NPDC086080 TaxID=3365748 RepID=UPI0037CE2391